MMKKLELPSGAGGVFLFGTEAEIAEQERVLYGRHAFMVGYCSSRGWPTDGAQLSIEQVLEIRSQDGWKNPVQS